MTQPLLSETHESVLKSCLLLQKSVLNELVDEGEHHSVGSGLDGEGRSRGEGEEDPGGEDEEENRSCEKIHHAHCVCSSLRKSSKTASSKVHLNDSSRDNA